MSAHICVFEGDDAAPEAVRPTVELLKNLDIGLTFETPDIDEHVEELTLLSIPAELRERIDGADTVLFGASSGKHRPVIRYLRGRYDDGAGLPVNVRPVRYLEGSHSPLRNPDGVEYTILRENLEGLYARAEGELPELSATFPDTVSLQTGRSLSDYGEGKYAFRIASEDNMRQFARLSCELATEWSDGAPARFTCADKSNALPETDGLFQDVVKSTVAEYDNLEFEHLHVDNLGQLLVTDPRRFDYIAIPNLMGDILSDVGAGTVGGLGLAPSGCYSSNRAYFEPVHGTAPDIEGQNVINPTATILSAVMMLEHLGYETAAENLRTAVEAVYRNGGPLTPDQGGTASTTEMADAIGDNL